jgi:D-alanine-D-alanine ligase
VAFHFDTKVLIEKAFTKDMEVNISFMGIWNDTVEHSVSEEVYSDTEFLDFENKYLKGAQSKKSTGGSKGMASTNRNIPAKISETLLAKLTRDGEKAFRLLNCAGVVRIDFLVNKKTEEYVLVEVNTIPGSLAFYLWEKSGITFDMLTEKMIDLAFKKHALQQQKTRTFSSQIFKNL